MKKHICLLVFTACFLCSTSLTFAQITIAQAIMPTCDASYAPAADGSVTVYDPDGLAIEYTALEVMDYRAGAAFPAWQSSNTFTNLLPGRYIIKMRDAFLNEDTSNYYTLSSSCCNAISSGGLIANDQTLCGQGTPAELVSLQDASGGQGPTVYLWMYTQGDFSEWTPIMNSNSPTYQPAAISETTKYTRCAKRAGCASFSPDESNTVTVEVLSESMLHGFATEASDCQANDGAISLEVLQALPGSSYEYTIDGGLSWSSNTYYDNLVAGIYIVGVRTSVSQGCFVTIKVIVLASSQTCNKNAPVALGDSYLTFKDQSITGNVLTNDLELDGESMSVSLMLNPSNGAVSLGAGGAFSYTPDLGFVGKDNFTYQICDDGTPIRCKTASASIGILATDQAPQATIAFNDKYTAISGNPISGNVIANDLLPLNGAAVQVNPTPIVPPMNGSLTISPDGAFIYTPNANTFGNDQFAYQICNAIDATQCASGLVKIEVLPAIGYPSALNDAFSTHTGIAISGNVLNNDFHSANMKYSLNSNPVSDVNHGNLALAGNGDFTYTPNAGFSGIDQFSYVICDGNNRCSFASVSLNVLSNTSGNQLPVGLSDYVYTFSNQALTGNVLANDLDAENTPLVANSSLVFAPNHGSLSIAANGDFTYTAATDYLGTDVFTYEVCEQNNLNNCNQASVQVMVTPPLAQFPPMAIDDNIRVLSGNSSVSSSLTLNDYILLNEELIGTVTMTEAPQNGTAQVDTEGNMTYSPNANFIGVDRLTYEICANNNCRQATANLAVYSARDLEVDLTVYLEGPLMDLNNEGNFLAHMRADLNVLHGILPGQTPSSPTTATPPGQPYNPAPWNYLGEEGMAWTDANYENLFLEHGNEVVDWVLVSFRTAIAADSEVARTAALILQDGMLVFPEGSGLDESTTGALYILIEHRNHLGIMSPIPVDIVSGRMAFDFTKTNSFLGNPSLGQGQKSTTDGRYMMFASDANQAADVGSYDINALDKVEWTLTTGNFGQYLLTDFDMNGDVNGADHILWGRNNGISSRVPK